MPGIEGNRLRSSFVVETVPGTTPATPVFRVMHAPAVFADGVTRYHQKSLVASGGLMGDALLDRTAEGSIPDSPLVYQIYDPHFESLLRSSWSSDIMTNAQNRAQTMTHELTIPAGQGGNLTYMRYLGVEATRCQIKLAKEKEILINFDLLGLQSLSSTTTAITGATYSNPNNNDPFSSLNDFGAFSIAGFAFDDLMEATIDLAYDTVTPQGRIGNDTLAGIGRTGFMPKLTCKFYVDTNFAVLRDLVRSVNQIPFDMTINLGSVTTKKYRLRFFSCYADMAPIDFNTDSPFMTVTFTPSFSTANNGVFSMTRALV